VGTLSYADAASFLVGLQQFGWKLGLERMLRLLELLGNPQDQIPAIHIAGTNGKGSVAAALQSITSSSGYRTGLFTSPHLVDIRERMRIGPDLITKDELTDLINETKPFIEELECTFFEAVTAIAFLYFAQKSVDIAIYEVGLGGRLDATNVVTPEISIITNIDFDHTEHLGRTPEKIAEEKAGIIKKGVPCVIGPIHGPARKRIEEICSEKNSKLYDSERLCSISNCSLSIDGTDFELRLDHFIQQRVHTPLIGEHQAQNSATAVTAAWVLRQQGWHIMLDDVVLGLQEVSWPGRFEIKRKHPYLILDVAHNEPSIRQLCATLQTLFKNRSIIFIAGMLQDKNYQAAAKHIIRIADKLIVTQPRSARALPADKLIMAATSRGFNDAMSANSVREAIKLGFEKENNEQVVCITGSHYLVGEAMEVLQNNFLDR